MDITRITKEIKNGNLVIMPTDTIYGIMADATNINTIKKVFECKKRNQNKALILLASNVDMLKDYTQNISVLENEIINKYLPGKLTILLHKNSKVYDEVTGGSDLVGIRIPDNKELIEVINKVGNPLISTSANIAGKNAITDPKDIESELLKYISYVEDNGIINSEASSIIKIENEQIIILRKGKVAEEIIKDYSKYIKDNL